MSRIYQITDYYELVALHKTLMLIRFSREPDGLELSSSPYLAKISRRIVEVLNEMEAARGRSDLYNWIGPLEEKGERWSIAIRNAAQTQKDVWNKYSAVKKREVATTFLSPFTVNDEILDRFIQQVDEKLKG